MAKRGRFRKTIRVDGKPVSRTFASKTAAERWYKSEFDRKKLRADGIIAETDSKMTVEQFVLTEFLPARKKHYPKSTWYSDEQRLRDYVLPSIGKVLVGNVTSIHVRGLLSAITNKGLSPKTRDRVRALVSSLFNEAINRSKGPLAQTNPTFGLKFKSGKRMGNKEPSFLQSNQSAAAFLMAAKELSPNHFLVAAIGLHGGLRKQEMIPLRLKRLDFDGRTIEVSEKFEQASGKILDGTKGGQETIRHVPMGDELAEILKDHIRQTNCTGPDAFVLSNPDGSHLGPRQIWQMVKQIGEKSGVDVTVHGLRHTFGREFMSASNDMNALKEILGHTSLAVTQIYATLGKERLKKHRQTVTYRQNQTSDDEK